MILAFKIFVGIIVFARTVIKKDPAREIIDNISFSVNRFLITLQDQEVKSLLLDVAKFMRKVLYWSLPLYIILLFGIDPERLEFLVIVMIISGYIGLTIPWILDHKRIVNEYWYNNPGKVILLFPFFMAISDSFFGTTELKDYTEGIPYLSSIENPWLSGISVFILLLSTSTALPYVLLWIVSIPSFYIFMLIAWLVISFLKFSYNYISQNLFDVLLGALVLLAGVL